tara:strand:- start:1170 stop:1952 length:783 start_codon:yes stop_codon:yes gene_type:complete
MSKIENLVFHHHTSLGDHFICNGIVHIYAEQLCDVLHLPCHHRYLETIECLYQDFDNIVVHPFNDDWATLEQEMFPWAQEKNWPVTRIGFEKVYYRQLKRENTPPEFFAVNFDRQFYEEANILFKERYDRFTLPKEIPGSQDVYEKLSGGKEYIIVHKNSSAEGDYPIDLWSWRKENDQGVKIVEIALGQTTNMLAYMKLIENAKEIHCVNSSFYCLVDSVAKHIKPNLFYHDIRMNNITQTNCAANNNRWTVINYPFKK